MLCIKNLSRILVFMYFHLGDPKSPAYLEGLVNYLNEICSNGISNIKPDGQPLKCKVIYTVMDRVAYRFEIILIILKSV